MSRLWSLLLLGLAAITIGVEACAPGFEPFYDGKCVQVLQGRPMDYSYWKIKCSQLGGLPVTIHSKEENDALVKASKQFALKHETPDEHPIRPYDQKWIGLKCGEKEGVFVWEDGSIANYTNFADESITRSCSSGNPSFYLHPKTGLWNAYDNRNSQIMCENLHKTDDRCPLDMGLVTSSTGDVCIALQENALTWTEAEKKCSDASAHLASIHDETVNNYIKRKAIAQKLPHGIHIGAQISNQSIWSDGTAMDYENYYPGFPDDEEGDCVEMQTGIPFNGKWVNSDCDTKLPYACGLPATVYPSVPADCPSKQQYRAGDSIYSPGFPYNGTAIECESYVLRVPKAKRIELTVVVFESNLCCDTLTLYDGLMSEEPMEVLSGVIAAGTKFTSKTHYMRMSWNATNAVNVRGFYLEMRQV